MVLEISNFKVRNLSKMDATICRFLASFSLKYDVTDAILQDIEEMKVQYLRSLLFDLFEICRLLEVSIRISLVFKFRCYSNSNENIRPLFENKGLLFHQNKKSVSLAILQHLTLLTVITKLYCFKLLLEHHFS